MESRAAVDSESIVASVIDSARRYDQIIQVYVAGTIKDRKESDVSLQCTTT